MGYPRLVITVGILLVLAAIAAGWVHYRGIRMKDLSVGSAAQDDVRFFSLRGLDTGAADDPASPVADLVSRLRAARVPFALHETVRERENAASDPDNADLYPAGPASGPPRVVLYEFFVPRRDFATADRVARQYTCDLEQQHNPPMQWVRREKEEVFSGL